MNIALVGWGVETKSAYRYFGKEHTYVIVSEEPVKDAPRTSNVEIRQLEETRKPGLTSTVDDLSYLGNLEDFDRIIYTPTARKNLEKMYPEDSIFWQKAQSSLHIFFELCPTKNIIGVTGTKGKGTTTTLTARLLEAAGKHVHIGGNIGIPVLDLLGDIQENDWVVLELSSFQLYKFPYSPHIAIHLMMIPEHIEEWHKTMEDYVDAKRNIFAHQKPNDIAIFDMQNEYSVKNVEASQGIHIPYMQPPGAYVVDSKIMINDDDIMAIEHIALPGSHNLENVCAALTAAWQISQDKEAYINVLKSFSGLEHRLQHIAIIDDIEYIDDSFGTTPDTALVAADAYEQSKVMIVGGHDKGNDFSQLTKRLTKEDIRGLVCIGVTGLFIATELQKMGFDKNKFVFKKEHNDWTMKEIVDAAQSLAHPGDIILLSTGSASFGIFKDYKDRGNQFIAEVQRRSAKTRSS